MKEPHKIDYISFHENTAFDKPTYSLVFRGYEREFLFSKVFNKKENKLIRSITKLYWLDVLTSDEVNVLIAKLLKRLVPELKTLVIEDIADIVRRCR